jgi:hydroxyethylthiazole kinase-like uncharacterized protein yjeF
MDEAEELLTTGEMARADRLAIASGVPGPILMERAGRAVASCAQKLANTEKQLLIVCGPGHNGGDGYVAARLLAGRGYRVDVAQLGDQAQLRGDAAGAARAWEGPVFPADAVAPAAYDLIIDGLFGAGLARDLEGESRSLVERINASGRPVIAIDVPSGLDGNTGQVRGVAIRANETVTFVRRKPGHLLLPGRVLCGRLHVADIGIEDSLVEAIAPRLWINGPALFERLLRAPSISAHKYRRGHIVIVSGGIERSGAARLAATAALRAGAGLVTVATPADALAVHASALTAVMVHMAEGVDGLDDYLADERLNAVVIGPGTGVGTETARKTLAVLARKRAAVLDADALTSFEGEAEALGKAITAAARPVVLTPHDGEFARLFRNMPPVLQPLSKVERARAAAAIVNGVVVLKGPDTVIAAPDGRAAVNENGTPWLATAGSGDVLSGVIGGLLAQGHGGFEAACAGVWLHAAAGEEIGAGLIAEDLPHALPQVLRRVITHR